MRGFSSAINKYQALSFKRLSEKDFSLLCYWLNQPHVRAFYQKQAIDLPAIRHKYTPRLKSNSTIHCFIIYFNQIPIGYIQTYLVRDYLDYASIIGTENGACIDLYIGEGAFLKQGLGCLIELKFLHEITFPITSTDECYISHAKANLAALKSSHKAGFRYLKDVVEDSQIDELLMITKEQVLFQVAYLSKNNFTEI